MACVMTVRMVEKWLCVYFILHLRLSIPCSVVLEWFEYFLGMLEQYPTRVCYPFRLFIIVKRATVKSIALCM